MKEGMKHSDASKDTDRLIKNMKITKQNSSDC